MNSILSKIAQNRLIIPHRPFYRKRPFTSPVSIKSANNRGCVDTELRFFYNRIPKAANSLIMVNLAALRTGDKIPSKQAKQLFMTPAQLRRKEVMELDGYFRFVIVRNPYTRLLSAYLDKVERKAHSRNRTSSFAEFLAYLDKGGLYSNAHWAPQTALLLLPLQQFDFVGKFEELQQDLPYALKKIGGPKAAYDLQLPPSNATGANARLAEFYTSKQVDLVKRLYREDFETLGYDMETVE